MENRCLYKGKMNEEIKLTENEAIEAIKSNKPTSGYIILNKALDMSIKALEEIQQYRAIGTVEECGAAVEKQKARKLEVRKAKNGDIESELRDFITPEGKIVRCPTCRSCLAFEMKFCCDCGQKLDWSEVK